MVARELRLTKKVTGDKEGAGPPLPRIVVEREPEVEPRRFHVLKADIDAHGHTRGCPGCAALASHGKATKPHMHTKTESLRQSEPKERKRARVERGARDVPVEPWNRDDEQVAVRHADASGGDITENQHEENRMRDIRVGKRGSEAADEEQPDKLRKTVRFEQEAPSAAIQLLLWNIL